MNIKQLHYFHELAQHRHFAKAAKACFITQPTLSASITALEKSLGTELVVRNSQFVALTQAGEVVLRHAERMLQEQDALRQELSLFSGGLSGVLRIGVVPQSSIDIMPLLKGFNDAFPNVSLHLSVMTHGTLMEQLDLHRIDIGLGFDELLTEHQRRALDVQLRHPNPMALLGPLPPHLGEHQPLKLADLQDLPLILPSSTMQFRRYLDDAAARQQLSLRVVLETDSLFHLVNGVSHGLGRAVVSAGIAATARHSVTPAMKAFLAQAEA